MRPASYEQYINSPEWQTKRALYKRSRKWECRRCGIKRGLHLHHLTYRNFGRESLDDLLPLCSPCHDLVHRHHKSSKNLTIRQATRECILSYRQERSEKKGQTKKGREKARKSRKREQQQIRRQERAIGRTARFQKRLGLEPGETVIRIKPTK